MKRPGIISIIFFFVITSCSKEGKRPFSYWKINGDEYSSNNVDTLVGPGIAYFNSEGENRFDITFRSSGLPGRDSMLVVPGDSLSYPSRKVALYLIKGKIFYRAPANNRTTYLKAASYANKITYTLAESWFVNVDNASDSVLVEGVFKVPW